MGQQCGVSRNLLFVAFVILTVLTSARSFGQQATDTTKITGHENYSVTLPTAAQIVKTYRSALMAGKPWGFFYGKDSLLAVLSKPNCIGLRIYFGLKSNGSTSLVLLGVDTSNSDMLSGPLTDTGYPCPPFCDTSKTLGH